jgi:7-cyano-7-deazaguanine tRNA-ribosyltransferase
MHNFQLLTTAQGHSYELPLFLPVFEYGNEFVSIPELVERFGVQGIITNGYFYYKKREVKNALLQVGIKEFLGWPGLVVTDSGAFQQFSGPLYLANDTIIKFQDEIGSDIVSPLDVITLPGDKQTVAAKKLAATLKRIKEGLGLVRRGTLVGVQQGGRFMSLRGEALRELVAMGARYIALGSLVPFFNKNHDIRFVGKVIRQAREIVPAEIPMHLYGGGDPLELPFYIALGCNIFDSSSFIHYARDGWYMTPYGAVNTREHLATIGWGCTCPACAAGDVWEHHKQLSDHNLFTILAVIQDSKRRLADGTLTDHLRHLIEVHERCFPNSLLPAAREELFGGLL